MLARSTLRGARSVGSVRNAATRTATVRFHYLESIVQAPLGSVVSNKTLVVWACKLIHEVP
jgi:hypothetical protein